MRSKDMPEPLRRRFPNIPEPAKYASQDEYEEARDWWRGRIGPAFAAARAAYQKEPKKLLYRIAGHNGGAVFAEPGRAAFVASLHEAISASNSWGEFSSAIPEAEYEDVLVDSFDHQGEPRPLGTDNFSAEQISGWSDGDYPPWLQKEMHWLIPTELLEKFGRIESTAVNGDYWHIPADALPGLCEALVRLGFEIKRMDDLRFW